MSLGGSSSYEQKGWDRARQVVSSPRVANISDLPRQQTAVLLPHREVQLAICNLGAGDGHGLYVQNFTILIYTVCVCLCMFVWGGNVDVGMSVCMGVCAFEDELCRT